MISSIPPGIDVPAAPSDAMFMLTLASKEGCSRSAYVAVMLTAPDEPDELAAPGLTVTCRFIVPVNEFALDAVFAASLTASSALAGAVEEDPRRPPVPRRWSLY